MNDVQIKQAFDLLDDLERIKCLKYSYFFKRAWLILEPETKLRWNWHMQVLCDRLQKELERISQDIHKTKDIIVNIPPRSAKSYVCTIMVAPYAWSRWPGMKFLNSSHSKEISTKHCLDSRRLIENEWYLDLWGHMFKLTTDQNTKAWFENDHGGMRKSTSTGSQVYGAGCDVLSNDDPQDPEKGDSEVERETVKRHHGKTLYTRLNNQQVGLRIIIQQRLHDEDLTGYLLSTDPGRYDHYCFPAEITDDLHPKKYASEYKDGLFFPERFPRAVLDEAKLPSNLGEYGYAGQMLQNPSPAGGGLFKKHWWRFWKWPKKDVPPIKTKLENGDIFEALIVDRPTRFDQVIDSWDTSFEGEITSDDVVGTKWGKSAANKFLTGRVKGKLNFKATKDAIIQLRKTDAATSSVVIERSANGPALKSDLENEIPGIVTIPTGKLSKEERARISDNMPYAAQVESGNIYLPHPAICPWVWDYIEEHSKFPKGKQDGQVDSGGQAINFLTTSKLVWPAYQPLHPLHRHAFRIKEIWTKDIIPFVAVYHAKDTSLHALGGLWHKYDARLFLHAEVCSSRDAVSDFAIDLTTAMQLKSKGVKSIVGNDMMFDDVKRAVGRHLSTELKTLQVKASPHHPFQFDRDGSITMTNLMFSRNQICIHPNLTEANRQISSWPIDKGKPSDGFPICECLCLMVAELYKSMKPAGASPELPDYRQWVSLGSLKPIKKPSKKSKKRLPWAVR